jgi:hypothetical protein
MKVKSLVYLLNELNPDLDVYVWNADASLPESVTDVDIWMRDEVKHRHTKEILDKDTGDKPLPTAYVVVGG